jgi:solute carrier family 25 phosphate transporter 23/24/25/41
MNSRYQGLYGTMALTVREEGWRALYRGIIPTLLGSIPYEGVKFGAFDIIVGKVPQMREALAGMWRGEEAAAAAAAAAAAGAGGLGEEVEVPIVWRVVCGAMAGLFANVVTFPNDTVRKLYQLDRSGEHRKYDNVIDCYKKTYRKYGIGRFYRGVVPSALRMVPNAAIQFAVYGFFKSKTKDFGFQ